ncbi:MAG TPA: phosphatidate cytidylyltransferase [Vampirovibrionales bacterium]
MSSDHSKRLRGGILIALIGFGSLFLGSLAFLIVCLGLFTIATNEFIKLTGVNKTKRTKFFLLCLAAGFPISAFFSYQALGFWFFTSVFLSSSFLLVKSLQKDSAKDTFDEIIKSNFALFYVGWLPAHILLLRFVDKSELFTFNFQVSSKGLLLSFLVISTVVINDIASYYCGKAFGRTKIASSISPSKTIKGSIGGIVIGLLYFLLFQIFVFNLYLGLAINPFVMVFMAFAVNISAQIGDLLESSIKRSVGAKDSGNSIEGHGGVLDRFDSHIFPAPIFYYMLIAFSII